MKKVFLSSLCLYIIFDDVASRNVTKERLAKKGFKVAETIAEKYKGKPCLYVEWNQIIAGQAKIDAEIVNLL